MRDNTPNTPDLQRISRTGDPAEEAAKFHCCIIEVLHVYSISQGGSLKSITVVREGTEK
jgi:hypothetical protein